MEIRGKPLVFLLLLTFIQCFCSYRASLPQVSLPGQYLNGGFYAGRAWALQRALRRILDLQRRLRPFQADGRPFRCLKGSD